MPIIIPEGFASAAVLRSEGIEVLHQSPRHISTLRVGLLNLMSDKTATEVQFGRLLGATHRLVELVPALPHYYRSRHDMAAPYAGWGEKSWPQQLDGLIVTGAPLEHLPFEDVAYWRDLAWVCDWAAENIGGTLYVCWAAFAALYKFHGMRTRVMPSKITGVFQQQVMDARDPLTAGLDPAFPCPVSRQAEIAAQDMPWGRGLTCLAQSLDSGLCLVADAAHNAHYMFNHLEYDADTLKREYLRDRTRRAGIVVPQNYVPNDDLANGPPLVWRRSAEILFANWLNMISAQVARAAELGRSAA